MQKSIRLHSTFKHLGIVRLPLQQSLICDIRHLANALYTLLSLPFLIPPSRRLRHPLPTVSESPLAAVASGDLADLIFCPLLPLCLYKQHWACEVGLHPFILFSLIVLYLGFLGVCGFRIGLRSSKSGVFAFLCLLLVCFLGVGGSGVWSFGLACRSAFSLLRCGVWSSGAWRLEFGVLCFSLLVCWVCFCICWGVRCSGFGAWGWGVLFSFRCVLLVLMWCFPILAPAVFSNSFLPFLISFRPFTAISVGAHQRPVSPHPEL